MIWICLILEGISRVTWCNKSFFSTVLPLLCFPATEKFNNMGVWSLAVLARTRLIALAEQQRGSRHPIAVIVL